MLTNVTERIHGGEAGAFQCVECTIMFSGLVECGAGSALPMDGAIDRGMSCILAPLRQSPGAAASVLSPVGPRQMPPVRQPRFLHHRSADSLAGLHNQIATLAAIATADDGGSLRLAIVDGVKTACCSNAPLRHAIFFELRCELGW